MQEIINPWWKPSSLLALTSLTWSDDHWIRLGRLTCQLAGLIMSSASYSCELVCLGWVRRRWYFCWGLTWSTYLVGLCELILHVWTSDETWLNSWHKRSFVRNHNTHPLLSRRLRQFGKTIIKQYRFSFNVIKD